MNIIMIGFMASGKTTIGKALAEKLDLKFIDTDEMIVSQQKMEIKDIFSNYGEERFREIERDVIAQLQDIDGHVIAVGGGAVMYHDNLKILKSLGITVFLDAPLTKILENLKGKFRPLIGNTIDEVNIKERLEFRYPTYMKSDVIVKTDNLNIQQTVDEVYQRVVRRSN